MNQVTWPSGAASTEGGQKPESFPSHSTYYPDPNMSSLLAGDSLTPNKKDAPSLTHRELKGKGVKAALSASDTFLGSIYMCVQTAFS